MMGRPQPRFERLIGYFVNMVAVRSRIDALQTVADFCSDLQLTLAGVERFGLGLWHSRLATFAVEGLLFAACVWVYARATRPLDRTGRWSFVALIAFLVLVYVANVFGPPPPSVAAVAWSAQAIWLGLGSTYCGTSR